jgi:hypothetical protein
MNPHASPWNRSSQPTIRDQQLRQRWLQIKLHVTRSVCATEQHGILTIDQELYIAKHSRKFRLRSHLDWAHYTPRTIAQAIDNCTLDQYYEFMLADHRSDPNDWKDTDLEQELKAYYAARVGRCSLI